MEGSWQGEVWNEELGVWETAMNRTEHHPADAVAGFSDRCGGIQLCLLPVEDELIKQRSLEAAAVLLRGGREQWVDGVSLASVGHMVGVGKGGGKAVLSL